jgi:glycosyltransferase involved in cell wall biosynthesis
MNRGGVETWLMNVLRRVPREQVAMDIMVHTDQPAAYDDEVRQLGATLHTNPNHKNPLAYALRMRRILRQGGLYDVVHSHVHDYSGVVLTIAAACGVPVRLAHSHNDTRHIMQNASPMRKAYTIAMRGLLRLSRTGGLGVSEEATESLFGLDWVTEANVQILYCGIDPRPFAAAPTNEMRRELGIHASAFVIGHVGRFDLQKNHQFLLSIFENLKVRIPDAHLMLVGDGLLRTAIQQLVRSRGIRDVHFCGVRADIAAVFEAMDVFVFPSLHEGLPLVCLEAQAAGVPILMSDRITRELIIQHEFVGIQSLEDSAVSWAEAAAALRDRRRPGAKAAHVVASSPFAIAASIRALTAAYAEQLASI